MPRFTQTTISKAPAEERHFLRALHTTRDFTDTTPSHYDIIPCVKNDIPNLLIMLEELVKNKEPVVVHSKDTYIEFHQLLVATTIGYQDAVKVLANNQAKDKVIAAKRVQLYAILLWRISYSSIFREHLCFLARARIINMTKAVEAVAKAERETDERKLEEADEEGAGEEDMYPLESEDVALLFLRWTRLLVDHFSSLDQLSKYVKRFISVPVNIHLFAVKGSPRLCTPWTPVLESALKRAGWGLSKQDVMPVIQNYLAKHRIGGRFSSFTPAGSSKFYAEHVVLNSTLHCEAALAAMMKYSQKGMDMAGVWTVSMASASSFDLSDILYFTVRSAR